MSVEESDNLNTTDGSSLTDFPGSSTWTLNENEQNNFEEQRKETKAGKRKTKTSYTDEKREKWNAYQRKYYASLTEEQRKKRNEYQRKYMAAMAEERREYEKTEANDEGTVEEHGDKVYFKRCHFKCMTEEQRLRRNNRMRLYQAAMSEEQRVKRRASNRKYQHSLTEDKRERRRAYQRLYQQNLTEEQREKRRANRRRYVDSLKKELQENKMNEAENSLEIPIETSYLCPPSFIVENEMEEHDTSMDCKLFVGIEGCPSSFTVKDEVEEHDTSIDCKANIVEHQFSPVQEITENNEDINSRNKRQKLSAEELLERKKESRRKYLASLTGEKLEQYKANRRESVRKYVNSLKKKLQENKMNKAENSSEMPIEMSYSCPPSFIVKNEVEEHEASIDCKANIVQCQFSQVQEITETKAINNENKRQRLSAEELFERKKESRRKYLASLSGEKLEKYKARRRESVRKYANSLKEKLQENEMNKAKNSWEIPIETSDGCPSSFTVQHVVEGHETSIDCKANIVECQFPPVQEMPADNEATNSQNKRQRLPAEILIARKNESRRKYVASLSGEKLAAYAANRRESVRKYAKSMSTEKQNRSKERRLEFLASLSPEEIERRKIKQRETQARYRLLLSDEKRAELKANREKRKGILRIFVSTPTNGRMVQTKNVIQHHKG